MQKLVFRMFLKQIAGFLTGNEKIYDKQVRDFHFSPLFHRNSTTPALFEKFQSKSPSDDSRFELNSTILDEYFKNIILKGLANIKVNCRPLKQFAMLLILE